MSLLELLDDVAPGELHGIHLYAHEWFLQRRRIGLIRRLMMSVVLRTSHFLHRLRANRSRIFLRLMDSLWTRSLAHNSLSIPFPVRPKRNGHRTGILFVGGYGPEAA